MNFDGFAIITVKRNDYRILFWFMSKDEAVNKLDNTNLSEKRDNYDYKKCYLL